MKDKTPKWTDYIDEIVTYTNATTVKCKRKLFTDDDPQPLVRTDMPLNFDGFQDKRVKVTEPTNKTRSK